MTDYKCDVCGWVAHESEWRTFRRVERKECGECGTDISEAYPL